MDGSGKKAKVGFIHTTPATIGMAETGMRKYLPGVEWVHIYDGNVKIDNFKSPVGITPKVNLLRYANFARELEGSGCGVVVSCCSLMPRATAFAQAVVSVPFIQLDAVILDQAIERYERIGVICTTEYTVPYVTEQLEQRAAKLGKRVEIVVSNNDSALALFNAGKYEEHDAIVAEDMRKLDERGVDCVLMGQIPFALMEDTFQKLELRAPILYAGADSFKRIAVLLEKV